ncbi:MAG: DUF4837 family protein [Saprospiraceae bacterium]|jgi:hypothetical protein
MLQHKKYLYLAIVTIISLGSCNLTSENHPLAKRPTAFGRINDVVILTDAAIAESTIKDTISAYFEAPYPVLTADEPLFDIRYMTPTDLEIKPLRKELRTYILLADVSDTTLTATKMLRDDLGEERFHKAQTDTTFTTMVGNDKWAKDQMIVYVFADGRPRLTKAIRDNFPNIAKKINQHDKKNLSATVYGIKNDNRELEKITLDSFGLNIKIPGLYQLAMNQPNFLWMRLDDKEMNQSIVIQKFPYINKDQFSMSNIIKMRNEYGKQYIKTSSADAYMTTNDEDLPTLEYTYINNGIYTKEVRGIWETVNDFMGGPFVSYLLLNEPKGEVVFIDVFVYAPGKDKRDYVQQLDCIVKTASFPDVKK